MLGAPPRRVWREVDLPLVLRALGVAAGFAFAISLGEFGALVFIARSDWPTVPVAIFRFLGRPGAVNAGSAAALSVVLMVVTAASVTCSRTGSRSGEACCRRSSHRGRRRLLRRPRALAGVELDAADEARGRARPEQQRQAHCCARSRACSADAGRVLLDGRDLADFPPIDEASG